MPKPITFRKRRRGLKRPSRRLFKPLVRTKRGRQRKRPSPLPPPRTRTRFARRRRPPRRWRRQVVRVVDRRPLWWQPTRVIMRDDWGRLGAGRKLSRRILPEARSALQRMDLARPFWIRRLDQADPQLIRFINRFYRVAGFEQVIRLYFNGRYQRTAARMLLRLAQQLAGRHGRPMTDMRFYRSLTFAPDGLPIMAVFLVHRTVHHVALPWTRLQPKAIRRLLARTANLFDRPEQVRLVFNGRSLSLTRPELLRQLQRILHAHSPRLRRWRTALPEMITLLPG